MTIARKLSSAGAAAGLAVVLAGCMGGGAGGGRSRAAQTGVEGAWIDAQGTGLSTFSGGVFQTVATDTGQKLAEGSYVTERPDVGADHRHVADPAVADQLQLPAGLDQPAQLHQFGRPAVRADAARLIFVNAAAGDPAACGRRIRASQEGQYDRSFRRLETRDPADREADLFGRLPAFLRRRWPTRRDWRAGSTASIPAAVTNRAALARLPVLRKSRTRWNSRPTTRLSAASPIRDALAGARLFQSPGPIWELQGPGIDPWQAARAFFAAGIRAGDIVHNAFSYHMTPGGFILDEGARALGCTVFPAGTGNTDMQVEAAAVLKPDVYCGTPDFLKVMLDRAAESGQGPVVVPARAGVGRRAVSVAARGISGARRQRAAVLRDRRIRRHRL